MMLHSGSFVKNRAIFLCDSGEDYLPLRARRGGLVSGIYSSWYTITLPLAFYFLEAFKFCLKRLDVTFVRSDLVAKPLNFAIIRGATFAI
jgi:hypothetical protein